MLVPTAIVSTFEMSSRTSKSDTWQFYRRHAPVAFNALRGSGAHGSRRAIPPKWRDENPCAACCLREAYSTATTNDDTSCANLKGSMHTHLRTRVSGRARSLVVGGKQVMRLDLQAGPRA